MAKGIDSGVDHFPFDREFPFIDTSCGRPEDEEVNPLPTIEITYMGLSGIVTIKQGDQAIRIATKRIRRLIDDLENVEDDEACDDDE